MLKKLFGKFYWQTVLRTVCHVLSTARICQVLDVIRDVPLLLLLILRVLLNRVLDHSGHRRTSTASTSSARSQWAPDLNRRARSLWALPGLNHERQIAVGSTGPEPDRKNARKNVSNCQLARRNVENGQNVQPGVPYYMPDRMPERMSENMPPAR